MRSAILLLLVGCLLLSHASYVSANRKRFCALSNRKILVPWSIIFRNTKANDEVVIDGGVRVLLDVEPPRLTSLTIKKGSALIWDDKPDFTLETEYILVEGELHIGSEGCPMTKPAYIKLTGHRDSRHFVSDEHAKEIRKVILVREDATIEIHGMKKTSWTRLAETVYPWKHYPCALIYDHADHKANPFAEERSSDNTLHAIAWDRYGAVVDYQVFSTYEPLKEFVDTLEDGVVISLITSFNGGGFCCKKLKSYNVLLDVIKNTLGGKLIDKVEKKDFYSLITVKGSPGLTKEHHQPDGLSSSSLAEETFLSLDIWETERVFQVAKSGKTNLQYFRVLTTDAAYPILELAENVINWGPGDKLVVASTDYDWRQEEVVEVIDCGPKCGNDKSRVRVKGEFKYMHFGNFTYNVDERAEVGLLTRNIVIEGIVENECYASKNDRESRSYCKRFGPDTFGGHIRILRGHAAAHIAGVELYHMGQLGVKGAYPLHFHMCDDATGSWFKDNSIHHSFQRCITIHGTDSVIVSGNVCYDHLGHGYFLEDGVEENNVFDRNLGIATKNGILIMSDSSKDNCKEDYRGKSDWPIGCGDTSTFWISHPNNIITNNAAAGGVKHGYAFIFAEMPLGLSFERQKILGKVLNYSARYTPVKKFYNNVAHSYDSNGVFVDSHIATGRMKDWEKGLPENGVVQEENYYEPRRPAGTVTGKRVWETKFERFTGYKNRRNNMWVKGGNINVTFCSLADGSMQSFSGGTTGKWTGVSIEYCTFIGRSDNTGEPRTWSETPKLKVQLNHSLGSSAWETIRGVGIYQGPMYVKHSYFDRFTTEYWSDAWTKILGRRPFSPGAAISFKRDSTYPTYTSQYTTNLTFGFCDNDHDAHWVFWGNSSLYGWDDEDGTKAAHNLDKDGSLTGTPNTYIVRNRPFFTGPECTYRPDWDMSMCPYKYIKVEFLGEGGSLSPENRAHWALVAYRDDAREDPYRHEGRQRREYLVRVNSSILIDYNQTAKFAAWPNEVKVLAHGVESHDVVRVGICVPLTLDRFEIRSEYPVRIHDTNYTQVFSLEELDADREFNAIFHDKPRGIIFVKVWSRFDRTNDSQLCPAGYCYKLRIKMFGGLNEKMRPCFKKSYPPPYPRDPKYTPKKVPYPRKCFGQGSPNGIGAVRWHEVPKIVHERHIPCENPSDKKKTAKESSTPPKCHGCFVSEAQKFTNLQKMGKSMTKEWCTRRCKMRGFEYAGLTQSAYCSCSHEINWSTSGTDIGTRGCTNTCSGNKSQKCGTGNRMTIWSTGKALEKAPPKNAVGC